MHTPAPWKLLKFDSDKRYCVTDKAGTKRLHRAIAEVSFGYSEPAETEQHANANLIAAAPELLAAAEKVLEGLHARIDMAKVETPVFVGISDLHSAIEKARGR